MMKRCFALLLAMCLACLCGCGTAEPVPAEKAALETLIPVTEMPAETPAPDDASALTAVLEEIRERARPGTAGASLTAAQLGVQLLDWAMQTGLDETQIRSVVEDYLAMLSDLDRAGYALQMGSVSAAVERLLGEESAGLLDDIGGTEGTLWPWEGVAADKLAAIFDAAGVNEITIDPNQ